MTDTPVFRLRIYRVHVGTMTGFKAEDPWNSDRPSDFTIEDYRAIGAFNVPMPALVSDVDRIVRHMPDSLCTLYQDGDVPAQNLPRLLKHIEAGLIRSDFLPVLRNAVFYASYLAFAATSCIAIAGTLLVLFGAYTLSPGGVLGSSGLIGVCLLWWHFGYRRKLGRRRQQKENLLTAMSDLQPIAQPAAEAPSATPELLTLDEVEAAVRRTAIDSEVADEALPLFGTAHFYAPPILQNDARPHIEVDHAYHYVVVERGVERSRQSTTSFDELAYWIFQHSFSGICSRDAAGLRTDGKDYRRVWFADQAERLARINPDWRRCWQAEVDGILLRAPYVDLLSLADIEASINQIVARLGISVDQKDFPAYGKKTFDGWYVEVDSLYHLYVQDRGAKYDELRTRNLDDLQYHILHGLLRSTGLRTRHEYAVPGVDTQRIWNERTADLMRLIKPDWGRRWEAEVASTLSRHPYSDETSP